MTLSKAIASPEHDRLNGEAVDGAALLDDVHQAISDYCILPSEQAFDAVTLWIAVSHSIAAFDFAPRLVVKSAEKRSGKSRLLEVVGGLSRDPKHLVSASVAYLFRRIEAAGDSPPTLLIDEADVLFGTQRQADNNEDLRGLLNSGFQRGLSYGRVQGAALECKEYRTFALAALAGIGDMPETIEDRAIVIRIRRRSAGESVRQFRLRDDGARLAELAQRLTAWLAPNIDDLREARPGMPVEDRAADVWEPLVAVANIAGGSWPNRAWDAALAMTEEAYGDAQLASISGQLLADIRQLFRLATQPRVMTSEQILAYLNSLDESPWGSLSGEGLDARGLARRLRPYGVRPVNIRPQGGSVQRGYRYSDLSDAWSRYLDTPATSATSATPLKTSETTHAPVADSAATSFTTEPRAIRDVADVADVAHPNREEPS
jgi:hypothetical protein